MMVVGMRITVHEEELDVLLKALNQLLTSTRDPREIQIAALLIHRLSRRRMESGQRVSSAGTVTSQAEAAEKPEVAQEISQATGRYRVPRGEGIRHR